MEQKKRKKENVIYSHHHLSIYLNHKDISQKYFIISKTMLLSFLRRVWKTWKFFISSRMRKKRRRSLIINWINIKMAELVPFYFDLSEFLYFYAFYFIIMGIFLIRFFIWISVYSIFSSLTMEFYAELRRLKTKTYKLFYPLTISNFVLF